MYVSAFFRINLLQQLFNGSFYLLVGAFYDYFGRIGNLDVRLKLGVFEE